MVAIVAVGLSWGTNVSSAAAESRTWTGPSGGDWHTAGNWTPAGVPSADDDVLIDGTPVISSADATARSADIRAGLEISGGRTLRLTGGSTPSSWSGGFILITGAGTIVNEGRLDITATVSGAVSMVTSGAGPHRFVNVGVVESSGPSVTIGTDLDNDGTLRVVSGTLAQSGSVPLPSESSGAFIAEGSGVLSLSNVVMGPAATAAGTGTLRFAGGTSTVVGAGYAVAGTTHVSTGGELALNGTGTTGALVVAGGVRRGTGTLTVGAGASDLSAGVFDDAGVTAFTAGSRIELDVEFYLSEHTLRLHGLTTWSFGRLVMFDSGTLENAGRLEVGGDVSVVHNAGDPGPFRFRNVGGTIRVPAGRRLGTMPVLSLDGGVLTGEGEIDASVVNGGGTVAPGGSPGTLTILGGYAQGPNGRLQAEILGSGAHDRLNVNGAASLGGRLELVPAPGFDPAPSAALRVLEAGSRSGTFATVAGGQLAPSRRLVPTYDGTGVTLRVGFAPVNTAAPTIPATGAPSDVLACDPGSWTGSPTFSFAWLRDGDPFASGRTYTLVSDDVGRRIACRVTATNLHGSAVATSNAAVPAALQRGPRTGETFNAAPARGTVTVRLPDGTTVILDETKQIVTGSVVDTRRGAVRLSAEGAAGRIETGVFSAGQFRVTQTQGRRPVTELKLVGKLSPCPLRDRGAATARRKRKRRLWGDARGLFRTRGRYGHAINDGTRWLTEDRCDGTLFRVARGRIRVRRNSGGRFVRVKAGESHLVRRPG